MEEKIENSRMNRRNILKTIGVSTVGTGAANVVAASQPRGSRVFVMKRNLQNPIKHKERESASKKAVESYRDRGGDINRVAISKSTSLSGGVNVAHAIWIDENGVPKCYDGFAKDEKSVDRRHRKLDKFKMRWEK
jgi:hypothetical protein